MTTNDSRHYAPLAVLTVLLSSDKQVLIMRRGPKESLAGMYTIPGGHIETGENVIEAAVRELNEETGVTTSPEECEVIGVIHAIAGTKEYVQFIVRVHTWVGMPYIAEPKNCDDMYWTDIKHLPDNMLTWPITGIQMALDSETSHNSYQIFVTNIGQCAK